MKKVVKLFGVLVLMLSLAFTAYGAKKEKLYVGTNAEFPPFEYLDGNKVVGFGVDYINAIADVMGKEVV